MNTNSSRSHFLYEIYKLNVLDLHNWRNCILKWRSSSAKRGKLSRSWDFQIDIVLEVLANAITSNRHYQPGTDVGATWEVMPKDTRNLKFLAGTG